jgi:hypothetical protein
MVQAAAYGVLRRAVCVSRTVTPRKRAIANGSGAAWQAPQAAPCEIVGEPVRSSAVRAKHLIRKGYAQRSDRSREPMVGHFHATP